MTNENLQKSDAIGAQETYEPPGWQRCIIRETPKGFNIWIPKSALVLRGNPALGQPISEPTSQNAPQEEVQG